MDVGILVTQAICCKDISLCKGNSCLEFFPQQLLLYFSRLLSPVLSPVIELKRQENKLQKHTQQKIRNKAYYRNGRLYLFIHLLRVNIWCSDLIMNMVLLRYMLS